MSRIYDVRALLLQSLTEARQLQLKARTALLKLHSMYGSYKEIPVDVIKGVLIVDHILGKIIEKIESLLGRQRILPEDIYVLMKMASLIDRYSQLLPPGADYTTLDLEASLGHLYSIVTSDNDAYFTDVVKEPLVDKELDSLLREAEKSASRKVNYLVGRD